MKPSPFCVLDEVDAPLDESNIYRFIRLLQEFKDQTQFIVITHNARTIEAADWIYGVTMEEPGVSRIVGVQLEDALRSVVLRPESRLVFSLSALTLLPIVLGGLAAVGPEGPAGMPVRDSDTVGHETRSPGLAPADTTYGDLGGIPGHAGSSRCPFAGIYRDGDPDWDPGWFLPSRPPDGRKQPTRSGARLRRP